MEALAWTIAAIMGLAVLGLWLELRRTKQTMAALNADLLVDTQAASQLAATQERARIAREMHDVVAHTLSVVIAQADGGRFAGASDHHTATRSLETIGDVSRAALAEMRGLLGLLRDNEDGAALGPQPTLGDIPGLISEARGQGFEVSLVTTGIPRTLPLGAGLAAYRIVQEGLTNVRRHAGPEVTAFVQLTWKPDSLTVTIQDDGRGAAAAKIPGGQGLVGMAERATVLGGDFESGPRAGGGYVVRARLPITTAKTQEAL